MFDVAVLGCGPAGASAALESARLGLSTVALDENRAAGGQVWRRPSPALRDGVGEPDGDRLRRALNDAPVTRLLGTRVWHAEMEGDTFRLGVTGPRGLETIVARRLIVATGARERCLPVPGWTLPGVIGLAAATTLMKEQKMLPGRRVLVAGSGPLLFLVSRMILDGGGINVGIVDGNGTADWLRVVPKLMARPDLFGRGIAWSLRIRAARVPIWNRHRVVAIEPAGDRLKVALAPMPGPSQPSWSTRTWVEADAVCLGHGLVPATEVTRLLGAHHSFDEGGGFWRPELDADGRTTVAGLYACGDGAGIEGVAAAVSGGALAGLAAAADAGRAAGSSGRRRSLLGARRRAAVFGRAMTKMSRPKPEAARTIADAAIVCRCEGVTCAEIDRAIAEGAHSPRALKAATRCGMGPCGGRFCADAAALLLADRTGRSVAAIGLDPVRPPLRPLPLSALAAGFDYADLPMPPPAPL